jgi:hypothetical protein
VVELLLEPVLVSSPAVFVVAPVGAARVILLEVEVEDGMEDCLEDELVEGVGVGVGVAVKMADRASVARVVVETGVSKTAAAEVCSATFSEVLDDAAALVGATELEVDSTTAAALVLVTWDSVEVDEVHGTVVEDPTDWR